jgi:hypothetical protein
MLPDLTFELDLQARCPIAFMARGARGSFFGLDQRLLEGDLRALNGTSAGTNAQLYLPQGESPRCIRTRGNAQRMALRPCNARYPVAENRAH